MRTKLQQAMAKSLMGAIANSTILNHKAVERVNFTSGFDGEHTTTKATFFLADGFTVHGTGQLYVARQEKNTAIDTDREADASAVSSAALSLELHGKWHSEKTKAEKLDALRSEFPNMPDEWYERNLVPADEREAS